MSDKSLSNIILAVSKPFSAHAALKGQPDSVAEEISQVITRKNYKALLPAAVGVFLVTVIFIISDLNTNLWTVQYPISLMNISAEIIHSVASVMFFLSHLDKKVQRDDLERKHMYSSLFLVLFTLGCSCYCLGDTIRGRDPGAHYFMLMVLCIAPILSSADFFVYYILLYMLPALVESLVLGTFDILFIGIYISSVLLHWFMRANFVRSEIHRINYERANRELEKMSITDPLTRVGNRQSLYKYLSSNREYWVQNKETVCLVMIDIDYFKSYNDTYSHLKGDECLVSVASVISGLLKDRNDVDSLFIRFGGEEFMFIMAGIHAETALFELYPKIREGIAGLKLKSGKGVQTEYLTISLGAHIFEYLKDTIFEEELKEADKQLYMVKENGRNGLGCKNNIFR